MNKNLKGGACACGGTSLGFPQAGGQGFLNGITNLFGSKDLSGNPSALETPPAAYRNSGTSVTPTPTNSAPSGGLFGGRRKKRSTKRKSSKRKSRKSKKRSTK